MPELAEVEFFRKQWDAGLGQKVERVELHAAKRIFRGTDTKALKSGLKGPRLLGSRAHGKRMLFRFSSAGWLGIHLGMSGRLRVERPGYVPSRHDHLVLFQRKQILVLSDPRLFGRVHFHRGKSTPWWWNDAAPAIASKEFTAERVASFMRRRSRLAVKSALLDQQMFPGVGNWMADEILWRARIDPRRLCASLKPKEIRTLWRSAQLVCEVAVGSIGASGGDPPAKWLFHQRWKSKGNCPRDGELLEKAAIGGRTTRWCAACQH